MANPNLNTATGVYGNNALVNLTATTATLIVSNPASSGKLLLIDSVRASNVDGTNACDVILNMFPTADNSGTATSLGSTIAVPADSSLLLVTKDDSVCLKEGQSLYATASAANDLHIAAFWKELS